MAGEMRMESGLRGWEEGLELRRGWFGKWLEVVLCGGVGGLGMGGLEQAEGWLPGLVGMTLGWGLGGWIRDE